MGRYVEIDKVYSGVKFLCEKYNIPLGGGRSSFGKALMKYLEGLPVTEYSKSNGDKAIKTQNVIKVNPISSSINIIQLKVEWEKTNYGYSAWVCRYGNVVTQSTISPERCFETHLKKLKSIGIDTDKISPVPKVIKAPTCNTGDILN